MRRKVQVIQADGARFAAAGGEVAADSVAGAIDVPGWQARERIHTPPDRGREGRGGKTDNPVPIDGPKGHVRQKPARVAEWGSIQRSLNESDPKDFYCRSIGESWR